MTLVMGPYPTAPIRNAHKAGRFTFASNHLPLAWHIHPASRGGPPTPQVFWFSPCKDVEHASKVFVQCFLIVFLQHPRNLYMFGHKVGPKHRFLQCCFNLFFKNNIIYAFFNIKLVQNTGFCSVFNTLTSQIL